MEVCFCLGCRRQQVLFDGQNARVRRSAALHAMLPVGSWLAGSANHDVKVAGK